MQGKAGLKIFLPVFLLLVGTVTGCWLVNTRPILIPEKSATNIPEVTVLEVQPQKLRINVTSQGVVRPQHEMDLSAEVSGKVVYLHKNFVVGGFFSKNELLLSLDPADYDYAIAKAQTDIAEARRVLAMEEAQAEQAHSEWKSLGEGKPTPLAVHEPQLAEARAKLKAAQANLLQASIKRNRCQLRAPFSGIIYSKNIELFQSVQTGEKLARLYDTDIAEVRLPLAQDQLEFLDLDFNSMINPHCSSLCPKVTFATQLAEKKQTWHGIIDRVESVLNKDTGLVYLIATIKNPYKLRTPFLFGLFVEASISGKELDNIFVPPATTVNAAQEVLLVDSKNHLHIRHLDILRSEANRLLIQKGLNAGDKIVTSGIDVPIEGMTVKIVSAK